MITGRNVSSLSSRFAHGISEVLSPFILVAVLIAWVGYVSNPRWLFAAAIPIVFVSVIPFCIALVMTRSGKVTDKFVQQRKQRHLYYAISLGSLLAGLVLVLLIPASTELRWITVLAVVTLLLVMVINTKLKISIHALIGALTAYVFLFGQNERTLAALAVIAWLLVSWSRVQLHRHTLLEVICGSLFGAGVGSFFLWVAAALPLP